MKNGTQLFLARGVSSAANHVGADVLICPVERSSTFLWEWKASGALLRRADEDICPYVVWDENQQAS